MSRFPIAIIGCVIALAASSCGSDSQSGQAQPAVTTSTAATVTTTTVPGVVEDGYRLVWSDEFEGPGGTPPDAASWNREVGGGGWGNQELEYYTDSTDNASLDGNGNLAIVAREEQPADGGTCWYGTCRYTSARLTTEGKVEVQYGKIEARIKVPSGQGFWPAFWMLGNDIRDVSWPQCGEIDIMENVGHEPWTVHGSVHGPGYSAGEAITGNRSMPRALAEDFHEFAVEWRPGAIDWYVDDKLYASARALDVEEWVFDHPFFLILNVAVGGTWPGDPDESSSFPQTMLVDWVRIWEEI